MMKRKLMTVLTVSTMSAATLAGGAAFASSDDKDEVRAFLSAAQDITAAIGAAETASGGTAVAAEFDESKGAGFYEVDTVANGKQLSVEIDATTGKVIKTKDEGETARAEDGDITDPARLGAPLARLVAKAEQSGAGKVMAISAGHEDGKAGLIEVELANADGSTQEFAMAADGTMTRVIDHEDGKDRHDDD